MNRPEDDGRVRWVSRPVPLQAVAAAAAPGDVPALLDVVAGRVRDGASLRLVVGPGGCVVLGGSDDLPWCPGAVYLGWEVGTLVPTTRSPLPAVDLLLASLRARLPAAHGLVAVVPWGVLVAPSPSRSVDLAALAAARADEAVCAVGAAAGPRP